MEEYEELLDEKELNPTLEIFHMKEVNIYVDNKQVDQEQRLNNYNEFRFLSQNEEIPTKHAKEISIKSHCKYFVGMIADVEKRPLSPVRSTDERPFLI